MQTRPETGTPSWQPAPLLRLSIAAHVAAAGVLGLRPSLWPWVVATLLADHALLTMQGLLPRSHLLGPNWVRLPASARDRGEVAITIDDGPDPGVTPLVLDILAHHGVRATFFCIGARVAAHASLAREIVRRGHCIENHSQQHQHRFSLLGPRAMAAQITRAQGVIADTVGAAPRFFRAPAGLRNPFLDPVLARLDLRLASWTRRGYDTVTRDPERVRARLERRLGAGDILLLHDGRAARTRAGSPVIVNVLPALLTTLAAAKLVPVTLRAAL